MRAQPAVTKGGGSGTTWLRATAVSRAQCSGVAEEGLCRLGRASLLEVGLVSTVAGANRVGGGYGYGHWWLRATAM